MTERRKVSRADEELASELSAWAEAEDFDVPPAARVLVDAEAEAEAARIQRDVGGRPRLDGTTGSGESPKRQVRLTPELDELLLARAAAENRPVARVMRDALSAYLHAS